MAAHELLFGVSDHPGASRHPSFVRRGMGGQIPLKNKNSFVTQAQDELHLR
jgi:hypothetical protein